ncbi:MAG: class I SAM-dependent methyltransferase [Rhodobacteraceae bacterium]|nr:class I SAM-dependent methyltransferase [Paracoccaceae bacterium]
MPNTAAGSNYSLRDEIKDYWGQRAATFDEQPGHEIFSDQERAAWIALLTKHLGNGAQQKTLDLASGTGVISNLLSDLDFDVTGMDWAEPMLDRARQKAATRGRNIKFLMADAENTMEPANRYEVVTCRHLVWTLVDPQAAFTEWLRILKPGGRLLIVDGDFVNPNALSRSLNMIRRLRQRLGVSAETSPAQRDQQETHRRILSQVFFSKGARAAKVVELLMEAGFTSTTVDHDLKQINKAQAANFGFWKGLERSTQHRYAICAIK